MKIIYRYLTRELIMPFLFGVAAFTAIFIGTDILFTLTRLYNNFGVEFTTLVQLFFLKLPPIIVLTFPMATLMGTLMSFGRLSGDGEITAFRAGGVSVYKIVIPSLLVGLIMSVTTIMVNEMVVPRANYLYDQIVWEIKNGRKMPATQYDLTLTPLDRKYRRPDYILYTHRFNGETGIMNDVYLQDYEKGVPVTLIKARKAVWQGDKWHFYNGNIYYFKEGERVPALKFNEYVIKQPIYTPRRIGKMNKDIEDMSFKELGEYIQFLEEQGKDTFEERVKYHQKIAIPFASFIFALLAAPLGIKPRRSGGTATGMGLSIIVIFIYYTIMTLGSALGERGTISPFFGAWLQNFIFLIVGGYMIYRMNK
ncbi:LptF/LptG family permease [Halothermothrix orenii]|uniref:Permease YjgP/YjgQ family protein n=1 Tax=Halothermothrix orenii (strain H 168 / OCM 544 / DSM 9562) TaxID=373903 RepID=B8CYX9_HALOH|nr:LptF/LptG family permease [Halothermothrix orenii]ACL70498.1 permease YjgP/YjgQ family protein [Halothermothrix orenii H 168]